MQKVGHIKNPLTVIAIFAAIAEISGTTVLPFIEGKNQEIYIWFLMLFPVFLVGIFFLTLNFNHKVLYAPSDYKNEDNFLKSFGKATALEKETKLREEVEEAEANPSAVDGSDGNGNAAFSAGGPKRTPAAHQSAGDIDSNSGRYTALLADVSLAEKLSILRLSRQTGLEFRSDVRFEAPSGRRIIFDGLAFDRNRLHAVEVKFFKSENFSPSRLDKFLLETELMAGQLSDAGSKDLILHFIAVVNTSEVDLLRLERNLTQYFNKYKVNIRLQVVTLDDLKNEHQYQP